MNKVLISFVMILAIMAATGCASKRYAKKAQKLDQAGYYRDAAQLYYQSVAANRNNIDARNGLQRSGQLVLNDKVDQFKTFYAASATKDAVYAWLDAEGYYQQVANVGVDLNFPLQLKGDYDVVKGKYLASRYNDGNQALMAEDFYAAETVFEEILRIEPTYKDCQSLWTTARYEPIYRSGIDHFNNKYYRIAWSEFNTIVVETNGYKDALKRRDDALANAQITIAVAPFMYLYNVRSEYSQSIRTETINSINRLKTPFYKVVPDNLITNMPFDGLGGRLLMMPGWIKGQNSVIKANTVLAVQVQKFHVVQGDRTFIKRPAYLKGTEEYKDKTTGVTKTRAKYDKIHYNEYQQRNAVNAQVEYALIDVRTGNILVSDVLTVNLEDQVNYAMYDGDNKKIVPGYWKSRDKSSPDDVVYDSPDKISQLTQMMNARRDPVPVQNMTGDAISQIANAIAAAIEAYNPEAI